MGKGTFISYNCFFDNNGLIKIGDNCNIGMCVKFITSDHEIGDESRRAGKTISSNIIIGNGVWIGGDVTILPGVTIGDGCIIGAGSVLSKSCDPNGVYVGVPAKRIRSIN